MPNKLKSLAQHFSFALPRALKAGVAAALCALFLGAPAAASAATHAVPDAAILATVTDWAEAWSAKDVERYLAFYAPAFKPPRGQTREAWEKLRRTRVAAPRFIEVSAIEVKVLRHDDARAAASFRQRYRSDLYQDDTNKTLELVRDGERWLIVDERVDSVATETGAAATPTRGADAGVSTALGTLRVLSALGQPLRAEVEVAALQRGEQQVLAAQLASPDTYQRSGIEFNAALIGINVSIERRDGKPIIALTTHAPVNEPFLRLLIELEAKSGRLVREYTVLLDLPTSIPPPTAGATMAPSAPTAAAPPPPAAPTAPTAPGRKDRRIAEGKIRSQGGPAAPATSKAEVKIAGADASKPGVAAAASADDREAYERAMKQAQARIKELENSAAELTKLIEARGLQIAELERRAAETRPAPALAPVAIPAIEAPKPALEAPKPAPGPKPAAKPRPAPPPPAPEPNLVDEYLGDPVMLGGLGAVMLLLVGYGAYAWRKKKRAARSQLGDRLSAMAAASVTGPSISAEAEEKGVAVTAAAAAAGEEIDPLTEADVYMAYGRDAQAEEILRKALQSGAGRPDVHLKLLQIYAKRQDTEQFEAQARKLNALVHGEGPEWYKAQALGRSIDPGNALYGPGEAADVAPDAGTTAAPTVDFDLDAMMGPGQTQAAERAATKASPMPALDIDLGGTTSEQPVLAEAGAPAAGGVDLSAISFDLDEVKPAATGARGGDSKWQKVAVKLDMADAYKEIGDADGARELLKEALEEGDAAQQAQARQMLASLG